MDQECNIQNQFVSKLYQEYSEKMMRVCQYYASASDEARDIFHDGFLKVIQNLDHCRNQQNPEAWIRKIMINTALERIRKKKIFKEIDQDNLQSPDPQEDISNKQPTVAELIDRYHLTSTDVYKIVEKLPYTFRLTFILYYREGYSHKEISDQMGIAINSSRANLARSKKLIRERLNRQLRKKYPEYSAVLLLLLTENDFELIAGEHEKNWGTMVNHQKRLTSKGKFVSFSRSGFRIGIGIISGISVIVLFLALKPLKNSDNDYSIPPKKPVITNFKESGEKSMYTKDNPATSRKNDPEVKAGKSNSKHEIVQVVEKDTVTTDTTVQHQTVIVKKTIVINK